MKRRFLLSFIVVSSVAVVGSIAFEIPLTAAQQKQKKEDQDRRALARFMRKKLIASELILEGLVTEDFSLISAGAGQFQEIGDAEKWRISNDVMFRQHSQEFVENAKSLQKSAKEKNLDAAALTWIKTTMSCIECHKWVRGTLIAK